MYAIYAYIGVVFGVNVGILWQSREVYGIRNMENTASPASLASLEAPGCKAAA